MILKKHIKISRAVKPKLLNELSEISTNLKFEKKKYDK